MFRTRSGDAHAPSMKPQENTAATIPTPNASVPIASSDRGVITLNNPAAACSSIEVRISEATLR